MTDEQWNAFFIACADILGPGNWLALHSESWCAYTTFTRLNDDVGYWTMGLPSLEDIADTHIKDGGVWGQPCSFAHLAHIIIPRKFGWSTDGTDQPYRAGSRNQNIDTLSRRLSEQGILHRVTDLLLEIKLY